MEPIKKKELDKSVMRVPTDVEGALKSGMSTYDLMQVMGNSINEQAANTNAAIESVIETEAAIEESEKERNEKFEKVVEQLVEAVIPDGTISEEKLAEGAVSGDKIADDAVEGNHIADGAISNDHIADNAIEENKLSEKLKEKIDRFEIQGTNCIGLYKNKNAATKSWGLAGGKIPCWCAIGSVTAADIYAIPAEFEFWKKQTDEPAEEFYVGAFDTLEKASKEWAKTCTAPAWCYIGVTKQIYRVETANVWGEKLNDAPVDLSDSQGLFAAGEAERQRVFEAKEATRDAANEAALNAAETLENQGNEINDLALEVYDFDKIERKNGYINSSGKWSTYKDYNHVVIKVHEGDNIKISKSGTYGMVIAFLSNYNPVIGSDVSFAGEERTIGIGNIPSSPTNRTVPVGCSYLYIFTRGADTSGTGTVIDYELSRFEINSYDLLKTIKRNVVQICEELDEKVNIANYNANQADINSKIGSLNLVVYGVSSVNREKGIISGLAYNDFYTHAYIPVNAGDVVKIKNAKKNNNSGFAFVTAKRDATNAPYFAEGISGVTILSLGVLNTAIAPNNAKYLYIQTSAYETGVERDCVFSTFEINGKSFIKKDLSFFSIKRESGMIHAADGFKQNFYNHILIPIKSGDVVKLNHEGYAQNVAFLQNFVLKNGEQPSYALYNGKTLLTDTGGEVSYIAPSNAAYLYLQTSGYRNDLSAVGDFIPTNFSINDIDYINDIYNRVHNLEENGIGTEDDGYVTEYHEDEDRLSVNIPKNYNANTISFGLITDSHITASSQMEKHGIIFKKLCEKFGMEFSIHLGDVFDNTNTNEGDCERMARYWRTTYGASIPMLYCQGNHEMFPTLDSMTQTQVIGYTQGTQKYFANIVSDSPSSYYSFDVRNCRFIVLNSSEYSRGNGFSQAQISWFESKLSTIGSKKSVVFMHIPYDGALGVTGTPKNGANDNKESDVKTIAEVIEQYANSIIAVIHGHTHFDNIAFLHNVYNISLNCDAPRKNSPTETMPFPTIGNPTVYDRVIGNISEYCMDFVTIDVETKRVYMNRFGCGSDRIVG